MSPIQLYQNLSQIPNYIFYFGYLTNSPLNMFIFLNIRVFANGLFCNISVNQGEISIVLIVLIWKRRASTVERGRQVPC